MRHTVAGGRGCEKKKNTNNAGQENTCVYKEMFQEISSLGYGAPRRWQSSSLARFFLRWQDIVHHFFNFVHLNYESPTDINLLRKGSTLFTVAKRQNMINLISYIAHWEISKYTSILKAPWIPTIEKLYTMKSIPNLFNLETFYLLI